jgi:hypothetical protein
MNEQGSEREEQKRVQAFNPNEHIIQLKSRQGAQDYLPVQWRLVWYRSLCPEGTIETELVHLDLDKETEEETFVWNNEKRRSEKVIKTAKGIAVFRATVTDGKGGKATGTKMEKAASFSDYLEKAETGSIGRALAALGYGTQFAPELSENHRIVDSPVDRTQNVSESSVSYSTNGSNGNGNNNGHAAFSPVRPVNANGNTPQNAPQTATEQAAQPNQPEMVTEQQLTSIHKLCDYLGKQEPEGVASISFLDGKKLIQQLTAEYRQTKKAS